MYYSTTIGLTILVASTLLSPCLCAPAASKQDPWWYNPCDSQAIRLRHSRSADNSPDPVKWTLKRFVIQLNTSLKNINNLYKSVTKAKTPGKLPWIKSKKMLKKMINSPNRLQEFHEALQFFAGTLDVFGKMKIKTNASRFNEAKRKEIYKNNTDLLKLLLCEVKYSLEQNKQKVPAGMPLKKMKIQNLKSTDLTGAHILDIKFYTKMKSFFKKAQALLNNKKGSKDKHTKKSGSAVKKSKHRT